MKWRRVRFGLWVFALGLAFLVIFLLISLFVSEPWIDRVDAAGILLGYLVTAFAAAAGLLSVPFWKEVLAWLRRREEVRYTELGTDVFLSAGRIEAIVIPVSRYEQPAWIIQQLEPQEVALLYTSRSRDNALRLAEELGSRVVFRPSREEIERTEMMLDRAHDPEAARRQVARFISVFERQGISKSRIFVDTTGGTAPMSIGAFMAAEEAGVSSIYVLGTQPKEDNPAPIHIVDPLDPSHGLPRFLSDRNGSPSSA